MIEPAKQVLSVILSAIMEDNVPPYLCISAENRRDLPQLLKLVIKPHAVIVANFSGDPRELPGCLCLTGLWNMQAIIAYLLSATVAEPGPIFDKVYAPPAAGVEALVEHTLKYDSDYRFPGEDVGADWSMENIAEAIREHALDVVAHYWRNGEIEKAKEMAGLVLSGKDYERLRELYYAVISRTRNQAAAKTAIIEPFPIEFTDDGLPIICVVDDMFCLAKSAYAKFQHNIHTCFGDNYQLAWIKDGKSALQFWDKYRDRITLFLLDMCFRNAAHFVGETGQEIAPEEIDPDFKRNQGKYLQDALRHQGYKGYIIVFSDKGGELLAPYRSDATTHFISKQDFFHVTEKRHRMLEEMGVVLPIAVLMRGMAIDNYSQELDPSVVHSFLLYLEANSYKPGRQTTSILRGIFEQFPNDPFTKPDIDALIDQGFVEKFLEDNRYYDWHRQVIKEQFDFDVLDTKEETWPLIFLKSPADSSYFLGLITSSPIATSITNQQLIFAGPDAPFCRGAYWLNYLPLPQGFIYADGMAKNLFNAVRREPDMGQSWEMLQQVEKKLAGRAWNPETTFIDSGSVYSFDEFGNYLYEKYGISSPKVSSANKIDTLFCCYDSKSEFYDNLLTPRQPPVALSRYFKVYQAGYFSHEFERLCFWSIAAKIDAAFTPNEIKSLPKDRLFLVANPIVGSRHREFDILLAAPYCMFFIEIKSYKLSPNDVEKCGATLYDVINEYARKYDPRRPGIKERFHCYRVLIYPDAKLSRTVTPGSIYQFSPKQIDDVLKTIASVIIEHSHGRAYAKYRQVYSNYNGDQRFIKQLTQLSKRSLHISSPHVVPIDRYFMQTSPASVSDVVREIREIERWNNANPLLIPYRTIFLDREQNSTSDDEYNKIFYIKKETLFHQRERIVHWKNWFDEKKLRLAADFFQRMQTVSLKHLLVARLSEEHIWVLPYERDYKIYLELDGNNLRYSNKVRIIDHVAHWFPKLLEIMNLETNDFCHYFIESHKDYSRPKPL